MKTKENRFFRPFWKEVYGTFSSHFSWPSPITTAIQANLDFFNPQPRYMYNSWSIQHDKISLQCRLSLWWGRGWGDGVAIAYGKKKDRQTSKAKLNHIKEYLLTA